MAEQPHRIDIEKHRALGRAATPRPWPMLDELEALRAVAKVTSVLVAEANSVARLQVRGYGMQGKLAYLRKAAIDAGDALDRWRNGGATP
jgi:hypothetical protein